MNDLMKRLSAELVSANKYGDADLADLLREAAAALQAAQKDAERYRWLRGSPARPCRVPCAYRYELNAKMKAPIGGEALDAAIDEAREEFA